MAESIRPFQNIQMSMDNIEERINKRMDAISIIDLAKFMIEFKQAYADIAELKSNSLSSPLDPTLIMSDEDERIVDLIRKTLKYKGKKQVDESAERKAIRRKKKKQ